MKLLGRAKQQLLARPRGPRWLLALAMLLLAGMYFSNSDMGGDPRTARGDGVYRPVLARGDGHMLYLMARSTAFDGDWNFDNDLGRFGDPWGQPRGPSGHKVIPHPIGPALAWAPLLWIADLGAVTVNELGADIPLHGYTEWHQRFVFFSSLIAAIASVLLGVWIARRFIGGTWSPAYAGVGVLLGTSLTYYATYMPSYGHALDACASAAFLAYWIATLGQWRYRRWIVLGLLLGVAMLIRVQEVALGIVVLTEVVAKSVALRKDVKQALSWWLGGALVLVVAMVAFAPQLIYWHVVYGSWLASPHGGSYTRFGSPMVLELLFSGRNGWFSSTPLAYAGVIGLFCLPRAMRLVAIGLVLAVAVQVYLNSTIFDWWAMSSFGNRRLCNMTLPIVVGLAGLIWRLGRVVARFDKPRVWHVVLCVLLAPFLMWNFARVNDHRSGKAAPDGHSPTCCKRLPPGVRDVATPIYEVIGNPFQFPANALFAIEHGVGLARWDQVVGNYPVLPPGQAMLDGKLKGHSGVLRIAAPDSGAYLVGEWSKPYQAAQPYRWTLGEEVTILVPNNVPHPQRITVPVARGGSERVTVLWDGEEVGSKTLGLGWTVVQFELPEVSVGEHELVIQSTPGPAAIVPPLTSTETAPIGVAVGAIRIELR